MKQLQLILVVLLASRGFAQVDTSPQQVNQTAASWLQRYSFNPALFNRPPLSFGPMARWWWPGNYVTKDELKREINLFADHGFAGVEIQPFNVALPP